jgi:hypothetical protein
MGEKVKKTVEKKVDWTADPRIVMVIRKNSEWEYNKIPKGKPKKPTTECVDKEGAETK